MNTSCWGSLVVERYYTHALIVRVPQIFGWPVWEQSVGPDGHWSDPGQLLRSNLGCLIYVRSFLPGSQDLILQSSTDKSVDMNL